MRSRIFSFFLSVLIFISSIQIFGFSKNAGSETEGNTVPVAKTETVICSFQDIAYGENKKQTFDLNLPVDDREEIGLVVFLHGGGWRSGDKAAAKRNSPIFNENKDYATASINYRLCEENQTDIYDIIDDITTALAHIKAMSGGYGMNIGKVILCGHSAGGQLALLYAYKYKEISPIEPVGVFATSSVPDLTSEAFYKDNKIGDEKYMCELMSEVCGVKLTVETRANYTALLQELSPVNFVTPDSVPTVVLHGKKDRVAPCSGAQLLDDVLTENCVNHEVIIFEHSSHGLNGDPDKRLYSQKLMTACIKEWFDLKPTETEI